MFNHHRSQFGDCSCTAGERLRQEHRAAVREMPVFFGFFFLGISFAMTDADDELLTPAQPVYVQHVCLCYCLWFPGDWGMCGPVCLCASACPEAWERWEEQQDPQLSGRLDIMTHWGQIRILSIRVPSGRLWFTAMLTSQFALHPKQTATENTAASVWWQLVGSHTCCIWLPHTWYTICGLNNRTELQQKDKPKITIKTCPDNNLSLCLCMIEICRTGHAT